MTVMNDMGVRMNLTDPIKIADAAKRIYDARFREEFEKQHSGQFVAIDVKNEEAYLGEFAESALSEARKKSPHGVFHLIRIGSEGAFRVSYIGKNNTTSWDWTLRPAG